MGCFTEAMQMILQGNPLNAQAAKKKLGSHGEPLGER